MVLFSAVITLYSLFRSTATQIIAVRLAADYFSKKTSCTFRIGGFDFSLFNGLVIEKISILDHKNTVLFSADKLNLKIGHFSLKHHILKVKKVAIDHGIIQLLTHRGDSSMNLQHIIDRLGSGDTVSQTDTTPSARWDISVAGVSLSDTRFHFQDENKMLQPAGMDYSNIDVSGINLEITDIRIVEDTIVANIKMLEAKERCGIVLHSLTGEFQVSPAFLKAHNLKILTDHSDLSLSFDFLYKKWSAYNDFPDSVVIQTKIEPSYVDLQDVGFFAPELLTMTDRVRVSGDIKGTVSNFKARNFRFAYGTNSFFYGNISAIGLPKIEETFVDFNIKTLNTNKEDIESFRLPGEGSTIFLPGILANIGGMVQIKGNFTGFYNDFVANAKFHTNLGNLSTDLTLKKGKDNPLITYIGQFDVTSFDLGRLVNDPVNFGRITMRADINGKGFRLEDAYLKLNLRIDTAKIYHYPYTNIDVAGILNEKKFSGSFKASDPSLKMDFTGMIDLGDSIPAFDFTADIGLARLFNLHLLKRDSVNNISSRVKVKFSGNNLDNLDGSINIDSMTYMEGNKVITMDHLSLVTSKEAQSGKTFRLRSDFVDAEVSGSFYFKDLIPSMGTFIQNYLASFTLADSLIKVHPFSNQVMKYNLRFKNTDEITALFLPFLKIADHSVIQGNYNEEKGMLTLQGNAPALNLFGLELDNWYIDAKTLKEDLQLQTGCSQFFIKKSKKNDSVEVKVDTVLLVSSIRDDTVHYKFSWTSNGNPNMFEGFAGFRNDPAIELKFLDFRVNIDNKTWYLDSTNYAIIDSSAILLKNMNFYTQNQYLKLNGKVSVAEHDTIEMAFNKVDISNVDRLFGSSQIDIDGEMSGRVKLSNLYKDITIISDLRIDQFRFNKEMLGDGVFKVKYDAAASRFDVNSQILYTGNIGTNIPFSLDGSVYTDGENSRLDFMIGLKNLNLRMIRPFVASFMSGVSGMVSGELSITGKPSKPLIKGELSLMRTEFRINYLNVPYSLADIVKIDSNAFIFNKIILYDSLGHKAILNGKITHKNFTDFRLGLNIALTDFSAFNNTRAQNNIFYGKARGSGNVSITGPVNDLLINVKAQSGGNTRVVIPISTTETVGQNDFILFVNKVADTTLNLTRKKKAGNTGITLNLGLEVKQDAEVEVNLPGQLGNLKASGTGNLQMDMTPVTPFTMSGTYFLTKGAFLFQLKSLLRLPMTIKTGSRITWSGDPADANISVSATYRTKAPLKGLTTIPEEEGIRIPVECIIRLGGKLMNPEMSFGIALPNVEESIRSLVFSAIDTNNASEMAQQTIYLLIMNQFKPVVATAGPSVDVGAASVSLMTNQINSWLSAISQNVNVGVNYRPATSTMQQEFDVAVSTQLFDNRLLIDGTFGMNSYKSAAFQQSNTIVGDINIEYVLTKNRRWRVHAYNRTNTLTILNNNSPYTQGVGITYQRDFASFGDLFRRAKKK